VSIVAILLSRGLSEHQVALFLTRVDHISAPSMMELLAAHPFTAQSYSAPYLPNLFNVPASEEELNLDYAAFQGSAVPPPTSSDLGSTTPLASGFRGASHGATPDLGNLPAVPPAPLPAPPIAAGAQVPGAWEGLQAPPDQGLRNLAQLEEAASAVLDQMNDTIGRLDPPAQLVPDIRRFGRDCLELGHDGIAAIAELGASLRDSTPPNSLVQISSVTVRGSATRLRSPTGLDSSVASQWSY
jgi:hypothetical protein